MNDPDQESAPTRFDAETQERAEATLKRMLATPPKPHKARKPAEKPE